MAAINAVLPTALADLLQKPICLAAGCETEEPGKQEAEVPKDRDESTAEELREREQDANGKEEDLGEGALGDTWESGPGHSGQWTYQMKNQSPQGNETTFIRKTPWSGILVQLWVPKGKYENPKAPLHLSDGVGVRGRNKWLEVKSGEPTLTQR